MESEEKQLAVLLGKDIRALRLNKKWTLADLSEKAGCSIGYLSEVERGERSVSIKFMRLIAAAFEVPVGWFFSHRNQPKRERGLIVRRENRKRMGTSEDGLIEELLSPDLSGSFEMFLTRINAGTTSGGVIKRGVEEEGYILRGKLKITIGKKEFQLSQGDTFRLNKDPFSWENNGPETTEILWVTSPPIY